MTFAWSDLGAAPAEDEVELSFFGPGFGECIVVHVGRGDWFVVDSCIDPSDAADRRPVAERYLRSIGVRLEERVGPVVATHWHDDHVRGLGRLVDQAKAAKLVCANVFTRNEFITYVQTIRKGSLATGGGKVSEFSQVLDVLRQSGRPARVATAGRVIKTWHTGADGRPGCELLALSPSDRDLELFFETIAQEMPTRLEGKRSASRLTPNLASVVLHLRLPRFSVLLCADMEVIADEQRGWRAVLKEAEGLQLPTASVVKVAHHGSANGHLAEAWAQMMMPGPVGVVTPYNRQPLDRKLPTEEDLARLTRATSRLFVTAPKVGRGARKDRDPSVARSLRESGISLRDLDLPIGLVRLRRRLTANDWSAESFLPAHEVARV